MKTSTYFAVACSLLLLASTSALAEEPPKSGQWDVEVFKSPKATQDQLFSLYLGATDGLGPRAVDLAWPTLSTLNGLGIDVAPAETPLRAQLKLAENVGLIVTAVPPESIGAKAGIKVHDVLIGVGDKSVGEPAKLAELLAAAAAHDKSVNVHLMRRGENVVTVATPKKPDVAHLNVVTQLDTDLQEVAVKLAGEHYLLGIGLAEADATLRTQLGLATGEGLVVTDLVPDRAAADAGVKPHDVLTVLDGTRLTTVEAINAQIQEIKDREVELRLLRSGKEQSIRLAPRKSSESVRATDAHRFLSVSNCQSCHANAWQNALLTWDHDAVLKAHQFHGGGQHLRLVWPRNTATFQDATESTAPQQQITALKEQLAAMQATLTKLEAALQPQEPAKEDGAKKEE
jgi:hypothetical protein